MARVCPLLHKHVIPSYTFRGDGQVIDLDAIVAGLELGSRNFRGFGLTTPRFAIAEGLLAEIGSPRRRPSE